ncbi:hypothetical protein [Variovorax atrisoli]|uniref:hypothetical protein n=1 Tax=Variovorax atrisoli TaxID=3394203 RepID=UPI00160A6611|nr:hypothetical protein [Variovorax sp. BK613]MBB3642196.1 hypothetical protein [Variovorax sp. BK613]
MRITIRTSGETIAELQVGTSHHPHEGPLPLVGDTIVVPEDADVDPKAKGPLKVRKIVWHYAPGSSALWPEVVCKPA